MSAAYPGAIKTFATHVNLTEIVDASHPNDLQAEVVAIESTLGLNPQGVAATVAARLTTIESTASTLQTQVNSLAAVPSGSLTMFAGGTIPTGWLLCNGQAVSRATYSTLFTAIGTAYGAGDGSTTFNVPNLVSRFPLGVNNTGLGAASAGDSHAHSTASHTLAIGEIPVHSHANSLSDPGHGHVVDVSDHVHSVTVWDAAGAAVSGRISSASTQSGTTATSVTTDAPTLTAHTHVNTDPSNVTINNANAGGGGGHDHGNVSTQGPLNPPSLALNFIIKT